MSELSLQTHVGAWVAERPQTSRVFERLNVDYCCHGATPLAEACALRGLDPQEVLSQLRAATAAHASTPEPRWIEATLSSLCDHIEQTHHAYLNAELPRLDGLLAKTIAAHGTQHPELLEVRAAFDDLRAELGPHMFKEERILFPAIRSLEQSAARPSFPFGTIANPIRMMEHEHDNAGHALGRIREATRDYEPPADACNTYRALLDGLRQLEQDMHQHVHKENNILFPRAQALEQG